MQGKPFFFVRSVLSKFEYSSLFTDIRQTPSSVIWQSPKACCYNGAVFISLLHSPLPLHAALLDLPVQPSATEVLGFGQTANASPSGLPFRFYEQSRRAPNDPTANRSVFASVDKVPGDRGPLPTHAALACTLLQTPRNSSFYVSFSALNLDIVDTKKMNSRRPII